MSDQTTELDAIARRIRALLAKTVENGATEAEALAAAAKARQMMDAHRLSQSDVEIEAEPIDDVTLDRPNNQKLAAVDYCLTGIDAYCGVKTWFWTSGFGSNRRKRVRMLGLKGDVEMASYLYAMIAATIRAETVRYSGTHIVGHAYSAEKRARNQSFQMGIALRVNERLNEMASALAPTAKTGSGTALVVVKTAVVNQAFGKLGIKLSRPSSGGGLGIRRNDAYAAGRAAGDRVNLSRPVNGGATVAIK